VRAANKNCCSRHISCCVESAHRQARRQLSNVYFICFYFESHDAHRRILFVSDAVTLINPKRVRTNAVAHRFFVRPRCQFALKVRRKHLTPARRLALLDTGRLRMRSQRFFFPLGRAREEGSTPMVRLHGLWDGNFLLARLGNTLANIIK